MPTYIAPGRAGTDYRVTLRLNTLDWVALILMIIGAVNWGLVGLFNLDAVAAIFGAMTMVSRVVYLLVCIAGVYGFVLAAKCGRAR